MTSREPLRVHDDLFLQQDFGLKTLPTLTPSDPAWITLSELTSAEACRTELVSLHRTPHGETLAQALILPGSASTMLRGLGFSEQALERVALISNVRIAPQHAALFPTLMYCAGRRARIGGAGTIITGVSDVASEAARMLGLSPVPKDGPSGLILAAQRMDIFMHRAFAASQRADIAIDSQLFADEVAETIRAWVDHAPQWTFFQALRERRLAREQYVYVLSNLYQFVRHTTRLIGRAISHCADPDLRKHWIGHLNGEVNHEVIIERDLAHLGEDVEFVKKHMPPNSRTQEFMAIQESMISYYEDPVLFMASPLAAEAITAHLDQRFVDDLNHCVAQWGVRDPMRATKFLTSHMTTDGGEDGHWSMSIAALPRFIRDEAKLSLFLTTNASSRRAIEGVWSSCIAETAVWSAA